MFAKALRGLRRLAIRFDAWMTEKPKPVNRSKDHNRLQNQTTRFMRENFKASGALRHPNDISLGSWDQ